MKSKRLYVIVVLLLTFIFCCNFFAYALDNGFSTESLTINEINTFLNNIELMAIDCEPEKRAIECFSVHSCEKIAVGFSDSNNKTICVYDCFGEFKYGYKFKTNGSFAIEWNKGNIVICFVRSDVILELTQEGTFVKIAKIKNTIENNTHWNNILYSTEQTIGNTKYVVKNKISLFDVFSSTYSNLIAIDEDGNESTIYAADSSLFVVNIAAIILMIVIFVFLVINRTKGIIFNDKQSGDGFNNTEDGSVDY